MKAKSYCCAAFVAASLFLSGQLLGFGGGLQSAQAKDKAHGANTAEPSQANFEAGVEKFKAKDFDGATDSFLQSTYFARNGYAPEAFFWLGKTYMAKHEDAKAIEMFKKHVQQTMKKTPQAHIYMAEIYLRDNKQEDASNEAKFALTDAMGPCPDAHNVLAKIMVKQGAYMDAETQFLEALGDHPWKFTDAWMSYAESKMKAKNWPGAYEQFEHICEAKGRLDNLSMPKVYLDMGICNLARGDHQGAIDHFHQALEIDPNFYDAHLELAILFEAETHYSSAIKEYMEFIRSSPADSPKVPLAKDRILKLQQKATAEAPPAVVPPSPYMREQQMQMQQQIKRQQQGPPKDSGF